MIDDYGHHPVEIRATLDAARLCKFNRVLVLFQPHRFSRTKHLWDEFCRAFNQADVLVLSDIYAAHEPPIEGVTSEALAAAIHSAGHKNVVYRNSIEAAVEYLAEEARPGDAIMTIGAGSVTRAAGQLAMLLAAKAAAETNVESPAQRRKSDQAWRRIFGAPQLCANIGRGT